jgi:hypothetical protein
MDSSVGPNNGDGLDGVEDVFDNPLRQTPAVTPVAPAQPQPSSPTVADAAAVFEVEESTRPGQDGTAARRTKMLRVKPEESDDKAKKVRNKTEGKQQQKDEKLRQQQQKKKGSGRVARLGGGMRRQMLRFQSSVIHLHVANTSRDDPRKLGAELMWKRIFAMLDFKNDHSLTTVELREGLEVVRSRWAELQELYPCGEAEFAEHLILGGSQDDPEQDPPRLMASIGAEGECEHFLGFAGFCLAAEPFSVRRRSGCLKQRWTVDLCERVWRE